MGSSRGRRLIAVITPIIAALTMCLLWATPAVAHSELVSSSPAMGSSSDVGPGQIVLVFDEPVRVDQVRAESSAGSPVELGPPVVNGASVTLAWPGGQAPGLYRLLYFVTGSDNDAAEGTIIFSYATAPPMSPIAGAESPPRILLAVAVVIAVCTSLVAVFLRRRAVGRTSATDTNETSSD